MLVCVACAGCGAAGGSGGGADPGTATTPTTTASLSASVDAGTVITVGKGPVGLAADSDGSVWVAQAGGSSVSRIRGGRVDLEVKGIEVPLRVAASDGSVWATAFGTGELVRITAGTGEVVSASRWARAPRALPWGSAPCGWWPRTRAGWSASTR